MQWQPDGSAIHAEKWFLGAGFLGAPRIYLSVVSWLIIMIMMLTIIIIIIIIVIVMILIVIVIIL